jgi:hypothetical protein
MLDAKESPITVAVEGGPQEGLTWTIDQQTKQVKVKLEVKKTEPYQRMKNECESVCILFGLASVVILLAIIGAAEMKSNLATSRQQLTTCNATMTEQAALLSDYRLMLTRLSNEYVTVACLTGGVAGLLVLCTSKPLHLVHAIVPLLALLWNHTFLYHIKQLAK